MASASREREGLRREFRQREKAQLQGNPEAKRVALAMEAAGMQLQEAEVSRCLDPGSRRCHGPS